MRELTTKSDLGISVSHLRLAAELHIVDAQTLSAGELIAAIEGQLGERAELESARWFVMSVLRHERQALWNDPDHADLSREYQYALAGQCLAIPEFVQSLKTVLKGDSCKFVLVEFRRTRNPRKHILANSTVAYRCALGVLRQHQLLDNVANTDAEQAQQELSAVSSADVTTTIMRRASRRGFSADATRQNEHEHTAQPLHRADTNVVRARHDTAVVAAVDKTPETSMNTGLTPQEYAELEQALSRQKISVPVNKSWQRFNDDERRSWLLGLLAGFVAFAIILFVFF